MNVAMLTNTYLPHVGGVARSIDALAADLRQLGHRVLIITPTFAQRDTPSREEKDVIRVPAIQNFNGSDFSLRLPIPLILNQAVEDFKPDIIHSHHPFLLGDTALRLARRYNIPLVFTHHTFYEKYTHYIPLKSERIKQFAMHLSTEYANLCSAVIAPSESVAELIKRRGVETPIEVIPSGVDLDFFARGNGGAFRKHYNIDPSRPIIGHLGRLALEKNLGYLAEAMATVLERSPHACFVLAGDGPVRAELEQFFSNRKLEQRVIFSGNRTGRELADALCAMDIFVFTSLSETQGMVLTEAMAAGVPVVALDAPGAREVVEDGDNGRLLDANASAENFADAVLGELQLASVDASARRWSARENARRFSRGVCVEKALALYRRLIACHLSKAHPVNGENEETLNMLDRLRYQIKAEWELFYEKSMAAAKTVTHNE